MRKDVLQPNQAFIGDDQHWVLGKKKKKREREREREKKKNPADLYIGTYTQNHKGKVIQSPHKRRQPDSNIPKPYKPFYPYPKGWSLI